MDKIGLVTGGTRGIGGEISYNLAKKNYTVIACYKSNDKAATEIKAKIAKLPGKIITKKVDISKKMQIERLVDFVEENYGHLDLLVNNAAINKMVNFEDLEIKDWNKIMDVNLTAIYLIIQNFLKLMTKSKNASIINITSTAAFTGGGGSLPYASSKGGLVSLTRRLARILGKRSIRVNGIAPTMIKTELLDKRYLGKAEELKEKINRIPLQRLGKKSEVAKVVSFLAEPGYINGQTIIVDGGRGLSI